jgi:hypothetical protein
MDTSIVADNGLGDANFPSSILADEINITSSSLQTCDFAKGSKGSSLSNMNYGKLTLYGKANSIVDGMRGINEWNSKLIVSAANSDTAKIVRFQNIHNLLALAGQAEPASPGIILRSGRYTVVLDFLDGNLPLAGGNTINCGNGVQVEYDQPGTQYTIVKYGIDGLATTGFEIIGGQKVVVMFTQTVPVGNGYPGTILPCPRGMAMKIVNTPNLCGDFPPPSPAGLVVYGEEGAGGIDDGQVYYATADDLLPVKTPLGVTLTNYDNNINFGDGHSGGYVLVSDDQIVVIRKGSYSPNPAIGASVFLGHSDVAVMGCFATTADDNLNPVVCLGYVLPTGFPSNGHATVFWQPGHHGNQAKLLHDNFTKTEDVALEDVPGLFVQLESGLSYKIRAHLYYSVGVTPNNGGLKLAVTGDVDLTTDFNWFSIVSMQELADTPGTPAVPLLEWVVTTGLGDGAAKSFTGGVSGWVDIEGVIKVVVGGIINVRFAQATSTTAGSTLNQGSSITAIKTQ